MHFTITTASGGGSAVDFGSITAGHSVTQKVTLTNDGTRSLTFKNSDISIVDTAGAPLPNVAFSNSSFGDLGNVYQPEETATFDVTYSPTVAGATTGILTVIGTEFVEDPAPPRITQSVPVTGVATASIPPTTPPTSPPTSPPTATPTPTPTPSTGGSGGAGSGGAGSGGTGTSTGTGTGTGGSGGSSSSAEGQLASTGLATQSPVLIGAAATSLGVAALLLALAYRRSVRRGRRQ
ncbi:MAG: hypothetical protein JWQ19_1510 [Subtercola sp.]|nr:hypothetical protein [Subtercola sp.]